jgi:hypothetical protein
VEQGVDRFVFAALAPPRGQQDGKIRGYLAAGMVTHHEEGSVLR